MIYEVSNGWIDDKPCVIVHYDYKTLLCTHEITIYYVDGKAVAADEIAYGTWRDLTDEELSDIDTDAIYKDAMSH